MLPFFALLSPRLQGSRRGIGCVTALLILSEVVRGWWLVVPASGRGFGLVDVLAMLGLIGIAAALALRAPLLPWMPEAGADAMSEKVLDPARHEPTDVGGRFIWVGVALVLASVFVLALIVLWLYPGATTDRTLRLPLPHYPNPQLQPNPARGHGAVLPRGNAMAERHGLGR